MILVGYVFVHLFKNICCGYSLEAMPLQMSTHSLYGELEINVPKISP